MSSRLLLGIDEGTTAVKVSLFDLELRPVASARRPVALVHPAPGLVEQDPELILEAVVDAVAEVLDSFPDAELAAAGLAHQGESVLAWDARSGRPLSPVIVWQDKRQSELLERIGADAVAASGLPLDPYFSAGKLAWLIECDTVVQRAREAGALRLGTVDSFLAERLGARHATDLSTASRTQLLAVGGRDWDEGLMAAFGLRREWLPAIGPSFGSLGTLHHPRWRTSVALAAQLVDQQAALAGSGAVSPGELKATYGTGVFVLGVTERPSLIDGLLPTIAWAGPGGGEAEIGKVTNALDGGVFSAGALLDWLARDLGLAPDAGALAAAAAEVPDSAGVRVLPALAGLGAPWWRPEARAVIAGLHGGVRPAHLGRAALEAIAWRVADIVEAISRLTRVAGLRVDGGLTNNETLLTLQADALGLPLTVGQPDTTVLGAAMLAGVGAGVFDDVAHAALKLPAGRTIPPRRPSAQRERERALWKEFVRASAGL